MARTTIDFGIDLGTTNSCIAVLKAAAPAVIKNAKSHDLTPSAVHVDRRGRIRVGEEARSALALDQDNVATEFKRLMGTTERAWFPNDGREMTPEELSAEVLKSLKENVQEQLGEIPLSAVITIPAIFGNPECEATRRAAQLAGFADAPLLQEPVAAALAYGFQRGDEKAFWLVYDLGGGTFDAAVLHLRDGAIQVINHGGDRELGGKDLDWAILEQILIPAIHQKYGDLGMRRGDPRWRGVLEKLKVSAEEQKILLSRKQEAYLEVEFPRQGIAGENLSFEYRLTRAEVERLLAPIVERTLRHCRNVLKEKRLGPDSIERVLLVGGPTLTPQLRDWLADPSQGLGIPLDFSLDPLTVVARGAAIFAGTQRLPAGLRGPVALGTYRIELDHKTIGTELRPPVFGKVTGGPGESLAGFLIEFVNQQAHPAWTSGKVKLNPDGTFRTELWVEKSGQHGFSIGLYDPTGNRLPVVPDSLTYTIGLAMEDAVLTQSVGVALASGKVHRLFQKGATLPAKAFDKYVTAVDVHRGVANEEIAIPFVQGEFPLANRNAPIGCIRVPSSELKRDVPVGTQVELRMEMDQSQVSRATAYIPLLDEEFPAVIDFKRPSPDVGMLLREFEQEQRRFTNLREKALILENQRAKAVLDQIDKEQLLEELDNLLAAASGDADARKKAASRLLDLEVKLDEIEELIRWPDLVAEANRELMQVRQEAAQHGGEAELAEVEALRQDVRRAVQVRDPDVLRKKVEALGNLRYRLVANQPSFWIGVLGYCQQRKKDLRDNALASKLFAQAERAIQNDDLPSLKTAVRGLYSLLPGEGQAEISKGFGSTVLLRE